MARGISHGAPALGVGLPATSTTGHPCKTGAWRCGKQNPFPTSPHPRRRLRTKVKRGVTLTFYLVQNIGQVKVGRYRGVQNQIGFDGLWQSPTSLNLVVEVKTTETYAIRTATLLNYIDELISEKRIASREAALGLYVVGRPDPELRQLENSIVAE